MKQQVLLADRVRLAIQAAARHNEQQITEALAPYGVSPSQGEVLEILTEYGPSSVKQIGQLVTCEKTSPSRLIKRMTAERLVKVEKSSDDARVSLVKLTSQGRRVAEVVAKVNFEIDINTSKQLTTNEQLQLEILLSKLSRKPFGALSTRGLS